MKCGTNTLGKLIPMHPRVVISKCRGHAEPMNPLATPEECAYPAYQQQPDVALRGYRAFQGRAIDDEERARNGTDEFWVRTSTRALVVRTRPPSTIDRA